jgi:acyl-[acyl-carrier-protein]-phospholipid O-acyltransferase / long-chain-fatty-acid--[acyl-carrier-protein] ligase
MISLTKTEQIIKEALESTGETIHDNFGVAAAAMPDKKTGEAIGIIYHHPCSPEQLQQLLLQSDLPKLSLPKVILPIAAIPVLGSGKTDHSTVKKTLLQHLEQDDNKK